MNLSTSGWIALGATFAVFVGLQRRRGAPPDLLFLGGLVAVTLAGVISPETALAGFANPAVLTVGALFAVASGLRTTGVLDWVGQKLLGSARTESAALARLAATVIPASAFILNTPLVAMLVPVVTDWCRKHNVSPSRLLLPLSYLTILGGVCTLIGTSTTLVVNAWLRTQGNNEKPGLEEMSLFEVGFAGLPCAIAGVTYLLFIGRRLLPNRSDMLEQLGEHRREYLAEMLVQPGCPLIGRSIEAAGLRHLPGLYLIEIDRDDDIITPVPPDVVMHAHDRLIFTGVVTTIADLERIPGLVPAVDMTYEFSPGVRQQRHLTEAVLSRTSPVIDLRVQDANFRERYNAAIVAVHRNGVRLTNKIGNIVLEPGDTLLLQTRSDFEETYRHNRDFYLISTVGGSSARRHDRAWLAGLLFVFLIVWLSACGWLAATKQWDGVSSTAIAALTVMGLMVALRCMTIAQARSAIDLQVLITIAAALGLGAALTESGAAAEIAEMLVALVTTGLRAPPWLAPYVLLFMMYLMAMIFTEMITNVAVAAMLLPLAVKVAEQGSYNPRPFVIAIALAASLSFITPIGYQTNLMVMGPGGYRPRDYLRVGLPLGALMLITAMILIPSIWPLAL